jgi:hypothetical protein
MKVPDIVSVFRVVRIGGRRCPVPVRSELDFGLEQGILAQTGGKDLEQACSELLRGKRTGCGKDTVKNLVEEDVDRPECVWVQLDGTNFGQNNIRGV